jgi:feruloyl esterase
MPVRFGSSMRSALLLSSLMAALCTLTHSAPSAAQGSTTPGAQSSGTDRCATLSRLKLDQVVIELAAMQAAGRPVSGAKLPDMTGKPDGGPEITGLPTFCRVVGSIQPVPGSHIRFEVWMPNEGWDGRFYGVGIGGFAGSIDYLTLSLALKAGQASVATDTGHAGTPSDSAWAKGQPERVRDYGWRAIHLTTGAAKKLVAAFYSRGPDHSYFVGCSGGGRQGLVEASRFPEDYDGILAGAPAALWTDLAISMINPVQAQLQPGAGIRREQARLLQDEVLKQCDALDGQTDGLVDDPRQCKLEYSKLACGASNSPHCFSPPQLEALKRIHTGARDASGRQLTGGYLPSGSEAGTPSPLLGWEGYLLTGPNGRPLGEALAGGLLQNLIQVDFATPATFDFNKDPARLKAALADLDAEPNLQRFFARGGKLILWHGWADAAIPPEATVKFHESIARKSGRQAKDAVRLFMVPGVQHCFGGTGPDAFGQLNAPQPGETPDRNMVAALQAWVEGGTAPETIVARRGHGGLMGMPAMGPERQRLLCAYPAKAVFKAGADPDKASSYSCQR